MGSTGATRGWIGGQQVLNMFNSQSTPPSQPQAQWNGQTVVAGSAGDSLPPAQTLTDADIKALQRQMGQTGNEAGEVNPARGNKYKLYVNSQKSLDINTYLATDGKVVGNPNSDWTKFMGYNERMIKNDIAKIDSGMKPLPNSIRMTRFVDGDALGRMMGSNSINNSTIQNFISNLENGSPTDQFAFSTTLAGLNYTHKGYTSGSYVPNHGSYGTRDVRLNMVYRQGTQAIVTNNTAEHEVLGGRNAKYNFTGSWRIVKVGSGKSQLVLDVYI